MKDFKLKRSIFDTQENEIKVLKIKDEDEVSAVDFFDMTVDVDELGNVKNSMGSMVEPIANICGITTSQVKSLHPSDYIKLSAVVGKYLG